LFGVQSLRMVPSFQGMGACFLPLLPQSVVDRLLLLRRWVTSDPGSDRYRRLAE
jgi:hypothetical protein